MDNKKDYFQLRIPRDLKDFFDEYVEKTKPLGFLTGNDLMKHTLIKKAKALKSIGKVSQDDETPVIELNPLN